MFLSMLLIDVGRNPDRPRPGRLWLRNLYCVHQRLCMAFPSKDRAGDDPAFLKPYDPAHFPEDRFWADQKPSDVAADALRHIHAKRDHNAGFLFRVDLQPGGRAVILVLSALEPDWEYAFHNARHLLASPPQTKPFSPAVARGQRLRFRLLANAVFRARRQSVHRSGQPMQEKWVGKRIGVGGDEKSLRNWIERRGNAAGFSVSELTLLQPGYVLVHKPNPPGQAMRLRSVRYEGVLNVTDTTRFLAAVAEGIGPGKAFGFGLLSLAPLE
jgi:CRISPR system Cascade subunit CasE